MEIQLLIPNKHCLGKAGSAFTEPDGGWEVWLCSRPSRPAHLGLADELLQTGNLSPDLVLFADQVMDTLGQLLLVRGKKKKLSST